MDVGCRFARPFSGVERLRSDYAYQGRLFLNRSGAVPRLGCQRSRALQVERSRRTAHFHRQLERNDPGSDCRRCADRDHVWKHGDRLAAGRSGPCHRREHKKRSRSGFSGHGERHFPTRAAKREKTSGQQARRHFGFYPQGDSQENRIGSGERRGDHSGRLLVGQNGRFSEWGRGRAALTFEEMMVAKKMGFNVLLNIMDFGVEALNSDVVTTRKFIRESGDTVQRFIKGMIKGVSFFAANKKFSMDVIARYTKSNDADKIEYGYDYVAKIFLKKPYPPIKGIQLALEEIGERTPSAKTANPEQFIDVSIVKELDQSGYIDGLYR